MKNLQYGDELEIRVLLPTDESRIKAIFNRARRIELLSMGSTTCEHSQFKSFDPRSHAAVSVLNEEVNGFIEFSPDEILGLYVDPLHQGKGVARRLLRFALKSMDNSINAEVLAGNEHALTLFFRHGFEVLRPTTIAIPEAKAAARGYHLQRTISASLHQTVA